MAITTPIQTVPGTGVTGTQVFNVASTGAGSLLIITFAYVGVDSISSVLDNKGNTWVPRMPNTHVDTVGGAYYDVVGAIAGVTSVTVTMSAGEVTGIFQEYSSTVSSEDQATNTVGVSGSPSSGATATLSASTDLVIGWIAVNSLQNPTAGSGFGNIQNEQGTAYSVALENLQANSNAAQTATFSMTIAKYVCGVVAYQLTAAVVTRQSTVSVMWM